VKATRLTLGCVCLLHLCSCTTAPRPSAIVAASELPGDVALNEDAGRGGWIIVMVRPEGGEDQPFIVDTGAGVTLLDKSLLSKSSKRGGTTTLWMWGTNEETTLYAAPRLYLGGTPLMTGGIVAAHGFTHESSVAGRAIKGVLGMDCLRHYCIQLDFEAGKMRFLDDDHSDKKSWGKAFPLTDLIRNDARPSIRENLLGAAGSGSQIDTGDSSDGWLVPKHFQQWTNLAKLSVNGEARSPNGVLDGEIYPQISLREASVERDGIGLHFLSRHLVTLDFPKQTMYLKRTSIGPLADAGIAAARDLLVKLKEENQLPGMSKDAHETQKRVTIDFSFRTAAFDLVKNGDSSVYHYTVIRASKGIRWKLRKAWRTDDNGKVHEEFPVP
jgi:hypothetical protein